MELFGINVSKKSQVFFIMLLLLAVSFFYSYAKNEVTLLVAIEGAWFVLFPYYGAYKAKSKHPESKIIHNYFIIAIISFIVCFLNMFIGLFFTDYLYGKGSYVNGFNLNLWYFLFTLFIILKKDTKIRKQKINQNKGNYINIDIRNLDFNELKEIPQEELERSMVNCLKNKGFSCMVGRLPQLNLLLSVDNQYSFGFNFLDTSVDIDFIESLARGIQTHNLKLVIISKEPYSEETVNRCMTNGLGIELLIEEDFKNITNYFYRPKYDVLGSSFFDLLQNKVLKY